MITKVNLEEKLADFTALWAPKIVGELNGQQVKLVKLEGEFVWHSHADEDELFLVIHGRLDIQFRDRIITLEQGEFLIVPRGVEHCPRAASESHVLLFEPASTARLGDTRSPGTGETPEWI